MKKPIREIIGGTIIGVVVCAILILLLTEGTHWDKMCAENPNASYCPPHN